MPASKIMDYLDKNHVPYQIIPHYESFTAQGTAAAAHVPGRELAKTVMVSLDGKMVMVVLPASFKISFAQLKEAAGAARAELAREEEFNHIFPGCEVGAMPPFGNLYGVDVYVSQSLREDEWIAFNAGNHVELIRMSYKDFERLVKPKVLKFSVQAA
ncbi:MAG: YbaK/EbsC family protein [bacterium]|nr:YbaK/EbsC family protein [bacterium]